MASQFVPHLDRTKNRATTKSPAKTAPITSPFHLSATPQNTLTYKGSTQQPSNTLSFSSIPVFPPQQTVETNSAIQAKGLPVQRKLIIGSVNDPLEAEADAIASRVMSLPDQSSPAAAASQQTGKPTPDTSPITGARHLEAPQIVHQALQSPGQPLDTATRIFFEPRFGRDLSNIRVHTDPLAASSARAINARAYTSGHQIVFGQGEFQPNTSSGDSLLAHELTHAQQSPHGSHAAISASPSFIRRQPSKSIDPEKSFFFEDPQLQDQPGKENSGIPSSEQQRHQMVVTQPKDYSKITEPKDPSDPKRKLIDITVRFVFPASEFASGTESSKLKTAKSAILKALAQLIQDLGSYPPVSASDEKRILQERGRLSQALRGFTQDNPLNIVLAAESQEETLSGDFFPSTARVFVNLKDVGNPDKLKAAIRIPLHNIQGGPNPARGKADDPASTLDNEKTLLHESLHALLISKGADTDTLWTKVQGQLSITGGDKAQATGKDLVHAVLLAQEEIFVYSSVELLFPEKAEESHEGKKAYEVFLNDFALPFLKAHGSLKEEKRTVDPGKKGGGKDAAWQISYQYPAKLSLKDSDIPEIDAFMKAAWPLSPRQSGPASPTPPQTTPPPAKGAQTAPTH